MTERIDPQPAPADGVPTARVAPRRVSFAWLLPLAAVVGLGVGLWVHLTRERGPTIEILFGRADGLEPGAEIVHRGIAVGVVRNVGLTGSMDGVRVTAELAPDAAGLASEGTLFWVVRPEVSLAGVEGLETLLGPRYIAARPGPPGGPVAAEFAGLDGPPPAAAPGEGALTLLVRASRAAGLGPGAPVLYRDIPVGSVRSARLADDATSVELGVTIEPGYASLVRTNSRFWSASGVGVDWGLFSGLSVRAEPLESLVRGAVSFATPTKAGERVAPGHVFDLAPTADEDWLRWTPAIPLHRDTP